MARTKTPATIEERNRAKDTRLRNKYGISLAEREIRAQQQNNLCKVCGGPLEAHGHPCVDHFHFKVEAARAYDTALQINYGWTAAAFDERHQVMCVRTERTKAAAIAAVKKVMMPWSIRGLLCGKCNYGLGMVERFFDAAAHPENLLPVIEYLRARLKRS